MITWPRMTMPSWSPWEEMRQMARDMQHAFGASAPGPFATEFPAVNIWSNAELAVLTAELPGIDPATIDISVQNDTVTIKGRRETAAVKDNQAYLRQERFAGGFTRSFALPFRVKADGVTARYERGILLVSLPRIEEEKPRKIAIKAA